MATFEKTFATVLVSVALSWGCASRAIVSEHQDLDDGRQWLEAGEGPGPEAPALVRAAAAAARNQTDVSEAMLNDIIKAQPASEPARRAHELLSRIYIRTGQYARLVANLDEWARLFPDDPNLKEEKEDAEQFRGLPDQITDRANAQRGSATLPHGEANDFSAPVLINGRAATYLLDTGAWLSVMTEAEAKRLGLTIQTGTGVLSDSSGKGVRIRRAVAPVVVLGGLTFHDLSFAILPNVEPWNSMPEGRGGIIGMPILLSTNCMRWTKGGTWDLGCASDTRAPAIANLVFYKNRLLAAATVSDTRVFMTLDTGAETTDLNAEFARQFAGLVAREGVDGTTNISGAGGTAAIKSRTLPQVLFRIGDTPATLRPAHVTLQENPAMGGGCCIGNLGLDLLLQSGAVTIDFKAMVLRLQ